MRLKHEEYVPYAPDSVGARRRVNHDTADCSGDSQSLSIWRNADDSIGAKCYRCGATGRTGSKPSMFKKHNETKALQEVPQDVSSQYADMPPQAAAYLSSKGITEAIAFHYGIGWSPSADGLIFPVINWYGYDQCQVKYFDRKQRYSTIHADHRETMFSHLIKDAGAVNPPVVIVEDLLSAIRVIEATDYDAFALLGSELNDQGLSVLLDYDQFFVWLDNDNDTIVGKAKKLADRLALFGGRVRLIKKQCEPKDISNTDIISIINRV